MQWNTHIVTGAALGTLGSVIVPGNDLGIVCMAVVGSLLPDIDHPESKVGRYVLPLSYPIFKIWGHRTITHSIWFLLLSLPFVPMFWLIGWPAHLPFGLVIGVLSHLLADLVSYNTGRRFTSGGGLPLLYPYPKRYGYRIVFVGGVSEIVFGFLMVCLTLILNLI